MLVIHTTDKYENIHNSNENALANKLLHVEYATKMAATNINSHNI